MATSEDERPRIPDYLDLLKPRQAQTSLEGNEIRELFRTVRESTKDDGVTMVTTRAPDEVMFAELVTGKQVPDWQREILLGLSPGAPRIRLSDVLMHVSSAEDHDTSKSLTVTRSKSRQYIPEMNYRLGFFIDDIKDKQ